jgi:hypothetical protein
MARNYTEQEREEAIGKIVRTSIDRLYGALGNRRTDLVFGQVQDAAAGVFITEPNAPYYVVKLANTLLVEQVDGAVEILLDLEDTVRATDRRVSPVSSISSLANARSALGALSSASEIRSTSLSNIKDVPAYKRFEQSTARFLKDYGKNIRSGGNIVQTPEAARMRLAGLLTSLENLYLDILRRVQILENAIADYDSLNLPAALSSSVIANSRDVIGQRFDELDALNERDRLEVLREVVLDVLTARSAVAGFGSLSPTVLFLYFEGQGGVFADAGHPATPATLPADIYGPYTILNDTELNLLVDGVTPITVNLPESYVSQVDSFIQENYAVTGTSEEFVIRATGETDVLVSLTIGAGRTAAQVAGDINTDLGGAHVVEALPYSPQLYLQAEPIQLTGSAGISTNIQRVAGNWSGVNIQVNDWVFVEDSGTPANDGWYKVTGVGGLPASFAVDKETGAPADSLTPIGLEFNRGGRAVRLTFKAAYQLQAIEESWSIALPVNPLLVSDAIKAEYRGALFNLGFVPDVDVSCQKMPAQNIVDFINNNPAIAPAGTPRIVASRAFTATFFEGTARTEPTDALKAVLYNLKLSGTVVPTIGNNATFTLPSTDNILVGDYVAIRAATSTTMVGNWGQVTAVGPGSIDCLMQSPVVADTVSIEVGGDYSAGPFPSHLVVANSPTDPNDGIYEVLGVGGVDGSGPPFELTLARQFIVHTTTGYQPRELQVRYGQYRVVLSSTSTLLNSSIEVLASSSGGLVLWYGLPESDVGDTVWFQLPTTATGVEPEDMLEFKDTNAEAISFSRTIFNTEGKLLELTESLPVTTPLYPTSQNIPSPSARIRKKRKDNYNIYRDALDGWLKLPLSNSDKYFADLRKLLNPIIVNPNPTVTAVQSAVLKVQALQQHLTAVASYLAAYEAPLVETVDRIIETYQQQGADRAVDTLLEARFADFFGLSQAGASYNGNLREAMRDVSREDLPLTKQNRNPGGYVMASYEEPNYEYDTTDSEGQELPDPTQESYEYNDSAF